MNPVREIPLKTLHAVRACLAAVCAVVLAVCLSAAASLCAPDRALAEPYYYTVTLEAGNQGELTGTGITLESNTGQVERDGNIIKITNLAYGDIVAFKGDVAAQVPSDSKYYVRGVRESGRDNNTVSNSAVVVTEDSDYVIAYGIKGDMVAYTVNFVDESGAQLAPPETHYGKVGDKPVVAYNYIPNYRPQANNIARTLDRDAANNVFTFVYVPAETPEYEIPVEVTPEVLPEDVEPGETTVTETTITQVPSPTVVTVPAGAGADEGAGAGAAAGADGDGGAAAPAANARTDVIDDDATALSDGTTINDDVTPLGTRAQKYNDYASSLTEYVIFGCVALIAAAVLVLLFMRGRKKAVRDYIESETLGR